MPVLYTQFCRWSQIQHYDFVIHDSVFFLNRIMGTESYLF